MPKKTPRTKKEKQAAVGDVMGEFKRGTLHSGSKTGPKVTNPRQAKAIAMSEAGMSRPKKPSMMPKKAKGMSDISKLKRMKMPA